ncbi:MAG: MBL fold metallo-hydrolase, partial [Bacilli bacterium]|nr:MBL fold metallo-hydrolase [Bacilli bacterium]
MKITKYPQSCLMVETNNNKILVDAGNLKYEEKFKDEWQTADIILITHKHGDHIYANVLKDLNIPIYSTSEVQENYPEIKFNIVKEKDIIELDNIKIEVVKAIHGYNPNLKDGKEVLENVGYIIDDGKTRLYITSDTICFNNDYKADVVALPVTAHGLTMSSYEASLFANDLGAKLVLPIHMDNQALPTDLEYMKSNFEKFNINYKVLN